MIVYTSCYTSILSVFFYAAYSIFSSLCGGLEVSGYKYIKKYPDISCQLLNMTLSDFKWRASQSTTQSPTHKIHFRRFSSGVSRISFRGGGVQNIFGKVGALWRSHASDRGVRGYAPPRKFLKMVQFGAFWRIFC